MSHRSRLLKRMSRTSSIPPRNLPKSWDALAQIANLRRRTRQHEEECDQRAEEVTNDADRFLASSHKPASLNVRSETQDLGHTTSRKSLELILRLADMRNEVRWEMANHENGVSENLRWRVANLLSKGRLLEKERQAERWRDEKWRVRDIERAGQNARGTLIELDRQIRRLHQKAAGTRLALTSTRLAHEDQRVLDQLGDLQDMHRLSQQQDVLVSGLEWEFEMCVGSLIDVTLARINGRVQDEDSTQEDEELINELYRCK